MNISCEQKDILKVLNVVSKAVSNRTTIPALKGIKITAEDGRLEMTASDLDLTIKDSCEATVTEPGSIIVMARIFSELIRKLPGEQVTIRTDEKNNVFINSMNFESNIIGMPVDEFPEIKNMGEGGEEPEFIEFDRTTLSEMIEKTSFAASIDEARGIITGVLIELSQEELQMVAIDGFRMAINRRTMYNQKPYRFVISAKILNEFAKIITEDSDEEKVKLYLNERKAVFRYGSIQAELKLLEGNFISYKEILPKERKIEITCDRTLLLNSLERASLLTRAGKNNLIKMKVQGSTIEITSDSDEGNVKEDLIVEKEGDDLTIGFNAHYILDVLKAIDDDKIKMIMNSSINPCLVEPVEGNDYQYLILPVRIN